MLLLEGQEAEVVDHSHCPIVLCTFYSQILDIFKRHDILGFQTGEAYSRCGLTKDV